MKVCCSCFNRTFLVLKYSIEFDYRTVETSFNRTFLVLKSRNDRLKAAQLAGFNRTFLVLKYADFGGALSGYGLF